MYNRYLNTFIQAAECGSFAKAADKLFVTTASVMKQINALEEAVGVSLFRRTNHGSELTDAGRYVYQEALNLISTSERIIQKAQEIADSEKHTIRIGSSPLRSHKVLADTWADLETRPQPFQLKIIPFSDDTIDLKSALKLIGKDFDCLVCSCEKNYPQDEFSTLILKSSPYCVALSRKHHLAKKELLTWDDLQGETIMLLRRGLSAEIDQLRDEIESQHPQIHIIDAPRHYSTEVFNQCAQMNYLMGSLDIWSDIHPSVTTVPVAWNVTTHYGIIYDKNPSDTMKEFIKALSQ